MTPFVGVDWGSTNLRAWRIGAEGAVEREISLARGVSRVARDEVRAVLEQEVRRPLGADLPALLCGAVASELGLGPIPYVRSPAGLDDVRPVLIAGFDPPVYIVPGLQCVGLEQQPDVMRGEETQAFGWIALAERRRRGRHWLCLPGTHTKWLSVQDGRIERFITAMTGELFDVLSRHSILRTKAGEDDPDAFAAGLAAAGRGDALAARLFTARARLTTGMAKENATRAYLSGLLIGAEIACLPALIGAEREPIHLVGEAHLVRHYAIALKAAGYAFEQHDGTDAAIAGLSAFARKEAPDAD